LHSQSYRIDPIDALTNLKQATSLTTYHHHDFPVESVRDRYIFVPKFNPRDEAPLYHDQELARFKQMAEDPTHYRLNQVTQLPDVDNHVLPERDMNNEAYRLYQPRYP
jgi:hypothetical protein